MLLCPINRFGSHLTQYFLIGALFWVDTLGAIAWADGPLKLISLSKAPSTWTPPDSVCICLTPYASLNNQGDVYFENLSLDLDTHYEVENEFGLWRLRNDSLEPLLRVGKSVEVNGRETFLQRAAGFGSLDDDGRIFVMGNQYSRSTGDFDNLWVLDDQGLRSIAARGAGMPGWSDEWKWASLEAFRMNSGGRAIIYAALFRPSESGYDRRSGIWFYNGSELEPVAAERESLPGLLPGETVWHIDSSSVALSATGDSIFVAHYSDSDRPENYGHGIWFRDQGGELRTLLLSGSSVEIEGHPTWLHLANYPIPAMNSNSQVLLRTYLEPTPNLSGRTQGLWLQEPAGVGRVVVQTNKVYQVEDAPIEFVSFDIQHGAFTALSNQGHVAFTGRYFDEPSIPNNSPTFPPFSNFDDIGPTPDPRTLQEGIWVEQNGDFRLVAKVGDLAPGIGRPFQSFMPIAMNNFGQVAFLATLAPGSYEDEIATGFWALDRNGVLKLVVHTGQEIDIAPGHEVDLRTVSQLFGYDYASASRDLMNVFNDNGQFLFNARFTDGTYSTFLSNAVAVPEPTGISLITAFYACTLNRRTRYRQSRP